MAELPQFSRNYGSRGGAYESPVTVIDSSGREYARAITNIGNSVAKVIQQKTNRNSTAVKETQKYLDHNAKFVLENYDEFSANMEKVGVNNPSLNKAGLFAIDKKAKAYMAMKSASSKEAQMAAAQEYALWDGKINELTQLIQAGKDANESYYADYVDGYSKANTEGGISTVNANVGLSKQYQLAMPVRVGATRNPEEQWFFDENDNWKIKTAYSSEQITQAYKDGKIKNNYVVADPKVLFAFDGGKIPNITADRNKFLEESRIFKNGKFEDPFVGEPELRKTENGQFEYTFRPIKFADIEAAATPFIRAQINSFLKFPEKAKNIWSHVLNKHAPEGAELKYANGQVGTAFDEESSEIFGKAYADWFLSDLEEKGGNASNYNKIEPEEPTAAERKAAKTAKEIAAAAPQVYTDIFQNTESYFTNKKVGGKDILKVNVLPGSVPADGGKVAPVIELGYKSGSKVAGEEQTIFTTDMSFDLSDPARVRALINMLPENEAMKKELIKLIGDNPIEGVSIETFEQRPILPGLSTN